jgi:hypothetical protein
MNKTIIRKGYQKKAYDRDAYTTSKGVKVPKTHVKTVYVPPTRIKARGTAAITGHKGKKIIDMKDYRKLSNYGYRLKSDSTTRRHGLRKAITAQGFLWPIHRLSAVRTLLKNTEPKLSRRAGLDIVYVQQIYKKHKSIHGREHRKKSTHRF